MNVDPLFLLIPVVLGVGLVVVVLAVGGWRVQRDTARRSGDWGINLEAVDCPECGEPAPMARFPQTWRQALWGGWTCAACGTEFDKWGAARDGVEDEGAEDE